MQVYQSLEKALLHLIQSPQHFTLLPDTTFAAFSALCLTENWHIMLLTETSLNKQVKANSKRRSMENTDTQDVSFDFIKTGKTGDTYKL